MSNARQNDYTEMFQSLLIEPQPNDENYEK